jgi:hypothetical protein
VGDQGEKLILILDKNKLIVVMICGIANGKGGMKRKG